MVARRARLTAFRLRDQVRANAPAELHGINFDRPPRPQEKEALPAGLRRL